MIHLYLVQAGVETDVTDLAEISYTADSSLRLVCDPEDAVGRAFARSGDMRINRNFSGIQVHSGAGLGSAADFSAGLRLTIMYTDGTPNLNLRYAVRADASAPVPSPAATPDPEPTPEPTGHKWGKYGGYGSYSDPAPTPAPVSPGGDTEELINLRAENAALAEKLRQAEAQIATLAGENAALAEENAILKAGASSSEDSERRIAELEEQLRQAMDAAGLKESAEALAREVDRLRREIEDKKNRKYELEMDELPTAEEALKKAQEALDRVQTELSAAQAQSFELEAALGEERSAIEAKELALADLKKRHTDAARALTELQELRRELGMNDEEREAVEQQLAEIRSLLETLTAELEASRTAQTEALSELEKLEAALAAAEAKKTSLTSQIDEINAEIRKLDKEIGNLDHLRTHKAREWEEKVRSLSAILADVLQTQLDLRATYELLTIAVSDEMFESRGKEAEEKKAELEQCSDMLRQVNEWVRNIKAMSAQGSEGV